jgi:hypothetical protein
VGRWPAGWGRLQRSIDLRKNTFEILIYLAIPKTQDSETLIAELAVAQAVAHGMIFHVVLSAIDFDNESMLKASEVNNIAVLWKLTAKMKAAASP